MVNMDNYEEYLLLYADGELGEAETKELLAFIDRHPELKAEMDMYAATKLVPDEAIVYNGKEQLLKKAPTTRTINFQNGWIYGAAAACVLILLTIGLINRYTEISDSAPIAQTTTEEKNIDTAVYEKLHSTPKNPVAVETMPKPVKPAYIAKTHAPVKMRTEAKTTEPVVVKNSTVATHSIPVVAEQPGTVTATVENNTNETIAIVKGDEAIITLPIEHEIKNNRKGLLASLPTKENIQGINELSKNVEEKIEKIKDISKNIRDTDVRFRLGKKELFIVRL
jgi:hypothetical protein